MLKITCIHNHSFIYDEHLYHSLQENAHLFLQKYEVLKNKHSIHSSFVPSFPFIPGLFVISYWEWVVFTVITFQQLGGDMLILDNPELNRWIIAQIQGIGWRNDGVWIGLHDRRDEGSWRWESRTSERMFHFVCIYIVHS